MSATSIQTALNVATAQSFGLSLRQLAIIKVEPAAFIT